MSQRQKEVFTALKSYKAGAEELLNRLRIGEIDGQQAEIIEFKSREEWMKDATNMGITRQDAFRIWQHEIHQNVLIASGDPAFASKSA